MMLPDFTSIDTTISDKAIPCTTNWATSGLGWAKIVGVYVYSWYAPPTFTLSEFEEMPDNFILHARGQNPTVITGHFNV